MKIKAEELKVLCTKTEWKLVQESLPESIGSFPLPKIRAKVNSAKRLYEKWSDLTRKQQRQAISRESAQRSSAKATLFRDVLKSFEKRAVKLEREMTREAVKKKMEALKKTRSSLKTQEKNTVDNKTVKPVKTNKTIGNEKKIQGHISARNKRSQAKKDGR